MRVIMIKNVPVDVYYEEWLPALEEIKMLLETGTVSSCKKAFLGLEILLKLARRPEILSLYQEADSKLAEVVRNNGCPDL